MLAERLYQKSHWSYDSLSEASKGQISIQTCEMILRSQTDGSIHLYGATHPLAGLGGGGGGQL